MSAVRVGGLATPAMVYSITGAMIVEYRNGGCGGMPLLRDGSGDVDRVEGASALNLSGLWRRPHIPTRGEEARSGLSLSSASARYGQKLPHVMVVKCGGAGNSSCTECPRGPVDKGGC